MIIESIKPGKRDKEKLVIRTQCGRYISARIDDAYMLKVGQEISEEKAETLNRAYDAESVKKSAARSLAHHTMSKADLSKKLRERGYSGEVAEETAEWFEEKGLVDDAAYARSCASHYKVRGWGKIRIREELRRRGISKELVDEVVSELPSSHDEIRALAEKKLRGEVPDEAKKQKVIAFLMRRGFKFDEIRAAMSELRFDTEDSV